MQNQFASPSLYHLLSPLLLLQRTIASISSSIFCSTEMKLILVGIFVGINGQYSSSFSWVELRSTKSRKQSLTTNKHCIQCGVSQGREEVGKKLQLEGRSGSAVRARPVLPGTASSQHCRTGLVGDKIDQNWILTDFPF